MWYNDNFVTITVLQYSESLAQNDVENQIFNTTAVNMPWNVCCGYLQELPCWGDSYKYLQHVLQVDKKKAGL